MLENQEGLPDYWGIETSPDGCMIALTCDISGRITRLLGY